MFQGKIRIYSLGEHNNDKKQRVSVSTNDTILCSNHNACSFFPAT